MRAVAWHGRNDLRVDSVPDPVIEQERDVIIRVTASGICGSDLHLMAGLRPRWSLAMSSVTNRWMGHSPAGQLHAHARRQCRGQAEYLR